MFQFILSHVVLAFCSACSLFFILFVTPLVAAACTGRGDYPPRHRRVQDQCIRDLRFGLSRNSIRFPWLNTLNNSEFLQSYSAAPMLPNN